MSERIPSRTDPLGVDFPGTETDHWIGRLPLIGGAIAETMERGPVVAVLRLAGVIGHVGMIRRVGLTLDELGASLERAFRMPRLRAVALAADLPGGWDAHSWPITKRQTEQ